MAAISARFAGRIVGRIESLIRAAAELQPDQSAQELGPIRIELHSIAGTAPSLGFDEIGGLARKAEDRIVIGSTAGQPIGDALLTRLREDLEGLAAAAGEGAR